jgi:hypothetical protein
MNGQLIDINSKPYRRRAKNPPTKIRQRLSYGDLDVYGFDKPAVIHQLIFRAISQHNVYSQIGVH